LGPGLQRWLQSPHQPAHRNLDIRPPQPYNPVLPAAAPGSLGPLRLPRFHGTQQSLPQEDRWAQTLPRADSRCRRPAERQAGAVLACPARDRALRKLAGMPPEGPSLHGRQAEASGKTEIPKMLSCEV
jgi:hypothetical protein